MILQRLDYKNDVFQLCDFINNSVSWEIGRSIRHGKAELNTMFNLSHHEIIYTIAWMENICYVFYIKALLIIQLCVVQYTLQYIDR